MVTSILKEDYLIGQLTQNIFNILKEINGKFEKQWI